MWKKKFVYVLNYLKTFKAVHKSNPRAHSLQQNENVVSNSQNELLEKNGFK